MLDTQILELLVELKHQQHENQRKIMTALESLTASVNATTTAITGLTAAVDTAVSDITTPGATDQQLAALQSIVDSNTASVNSQTARLIAATTPPTPVPVPPTP